MILEARKRALAFFAFSYSIVLFDIPVSALVAGFMGVGFWHLAMSQLTYWKYGGR